MKQQCLHMISYKCKNISNGSKKTTRLCLFSTLIAKEWEIYNIILKWSTAEKWKVVRVFQSELFHSCCYVRQTSGSSNYFRARCRYLYTKNQSVIYLWNPPERVCSIRASRSLPWRWHLSMAWREKSIINEESRKSNLCEVDAPAPSLVERGTRERRAKRCQVRRP